MELDKADKIEAVEGMRVRVERRRDGEAEMLLKLELLCRFFKVAPAPKIFQNKIGN